MFPVLVALLLAAPVLYFVMPANSPMWLGFRRFLLFAIAALVPYTAFKSFQFYHHAQALPAKLEILYPVAAGEVADLREGCGVAVYRLSGKALDGIHEKGVAFFQTERHGRGYSLPNDRHHSYYTYNPWQQSPVPGGWWDPEDYWFHCADLSPPLMREIEAATRKSGAYYTSTYELRVMVIPTLGYVVFAFNG